MSLTPEATHRLPGEPREVAAAVIPLQGARAAAALARALRAPEGRGRAVVLRLAPGLELDALLPSARAGFEGHCVELKARMLAADQLASRLLESLSGRRCDAPEPILRAYARYLEAAKSELAIVIADGSSLPVDTAEWLGALVREAGGALRIVLPWEPHGRLGHVCDALGLEVLHVASEAAGPATPSAPRPDPAPGALRAPQNGPPAPAAQVARASRPGPAAAFARLTLLGLACLALLAVAWWARSQHDAAPSETVVEAPVRDDAHGAGARASADDILQQFDYRPELDRVSFRVEGASMRTVLGELGHRIGFEVRDESHGPERVVSLQLVDAPLTQALKELCHGFTTVFVYASPGSADSVRRLRTLVLLDAARRPAAELTAASGGEANTARPEPVADVVSLSLALLLGDDASGQHERALEAIRALDPELAAREVLRQLAATTPIGPLEPIQRQAAWERLRTALCQSAARADVTLAPEVGCAPPSPSGS